MLRIINLDKHYKSKKGLDHHALKNINLEFGDKGFVFVLGKSGSGKSTLLNILGGLDTFDSGDIEIKGKSSRDFRAKDWDSYRNTYVGFVFQDFNIIENYSISKNIGLALELQGIKKKDISTHVDDILKSVDLEGYGKRKPNELSGGQMQRIAIARALVKSPEIILADEPTGNLDSNTGRQIMDNLKELSKDKLVIMVSHDQESAEKYADRIIELKDGYVERDIVSVEGKFIDSPTLLNVSTINPRSAIYVPMGEKINQSHINEINDALDEDGILYIPVSKKKLTENDILKINHLLNGEDTVMPIISNKQTRELKDNTTYRVDSTDETLSRFKNKNRTSFKLIKSVLPIGNSVKMAFVSIWRKKFKMIFSVLLFLAAVGLFGFSETVTKFDIADATAETYENGGVKIISLGNKDEVLGWDEPEDSDVPFSRDLVTTFMNLVDYEYSLLYGFAKNGVTVNSPSELVEVGKLAGFFVVDNLETYDLSLIVGNMPTTTNEIMLTDFVADYYIAEETYTTYQQFVGEQFEIEKRYYTITGIIDTDYESHLYLNDIPQSQYEDNLSAIATYQSNVNSVYSRIFVIDGFYEEYEKTFDGFSQYLSMQVPKLNAKDVWDTNWLTSEFLEFDSSIVDSKYVDTYLFVPDGFTELRQNEIIISVDSITQLLELGDDQMIRDLITDARTAGDDIYEILKEKGYIDMVQSVSLVKDESWERIDEKEYHIIGAVDFNYYYQMKNIEEMTNYLESENVDLSQYGITEEQIEENPWNVMGQLFGAYSYTKLSDAGVKVVPENEYWTYLLIEALDEVDADYLTSSEFEDIMIEMATIQRQMELGEETGEINPIVQEFMDRGFYVNIDDENIDKTIEGNYNQYINEIGGMYGLNPAYDYYGYIMDLSKENNITIPDGQPDMWNPTLLNTLTYNELNPYRADKPEMIVVKLQDLESNKRFFSLVEQQNFTHQTTNGLILQTFSNFRDEAAGIFRYVSIGLAAFAAVLMFTNISSSVLASKKEIGTLRAIGAKGSDVAKIFVLEALFVGAFTTVLAIIALQIGTAQLNASLTSQLGMDLSLFNSSWIVALEMLGLSIIVVIVAAFLPVKGVTIMKPINAIKNK